MILTGKIKRILRTISALVSGIFLLEQVVWAGNIATPIQPVSERTETASDPSDFLSSQSRAENLIASKNEVENFVAPDISSDQLLKTDRGTEYDRSVMNPDGSVSYYSEGLIVEKNFDSGKAFLYCYGQDKREQSMVCYKEGGVYAYTKEYRRNSSGHIERIVFYYPNGRAVHRTMDSRILQEDRPNGEKLIYSYLDNRRISGKASYDKEGSLQFQENYIYDDHGRFDGVKRLYSDGRVLHFSSNWKVLRLDIDDGRVLTFNYDENWNRTGRVMYIPYESQPGHAEYIHYDSSGAVHKTIRHYPEGHVRHWDHRGNLVKEIIPGESTYTYYVLEGTVKTKQTPDGRIIAYSPDGRIQSVTAGDHREDRLYVVSGGEVEYTLAVHGDKVRYVAEGISNECGFLSEHQWEDGDAISVTYGGDVTAVYAQGGMRQISVDGGQVEVFSNQDLVSQNSDAGTFYGYSDGYLRRAASINGNVYNFRATSLSDGVIVELNDAVINGLKVEFTGSDVSRIISDTPDVEITEEEFDIQVEDILAALRNDIANVRFIYGPDDEIKEIVTSSYSSVHINDGLISYVVSPDGMVSGFEYIFDDDGSPAGLKIRDAGGIRTYDASGELVHVSVGEEGSEGEINVSSGQVESLMSAGTMLDRITFDEYGQISSARLIDTDGGEYFFSGGMLAAFTGGQNTVYEVDDEGRITKLIKGEGSDVFDVLYIEDENTGRELTVFTDARTQVRYIYDYFPDQDQQLLREISDPTGINVVYSYDAFSRTDSVSISFAGKSTSHYQYEYAQDEIIITDSIGTKRYYGADRRPLKIETPYNETYHYGYDTDESGQILTFLNYSRRVASDGTVIEYFKGGITKITRPDGTYIDNIEFDADTLELRRFSVHTPEGDRHNVIIDGPFVQLELEDSTRLMFYQDKLVAFGNSQGITPLYDLDELEEMIYARRQSGSEDIYQGEADIAASSWRHQTYSDSMAIQRVIRDYEDHNWVVSVDMTAGDAANSAGEMYLDLRYDIPGLEWHSPIDMRGREISFLFRPDPSFEFSAAYPPEVQVFAKDSDWRTQYGTASVMEMSDGWVKVSLIPVEDDVNFGYTEQFFDPSRVIMIGLRMSHGADAPEGEKYSGKVLVKHDILPDIFENVDHGTSPLDELYFGLGVTRDIGRLLGEEAAAAESYLESFIGALGGGPADIYQENLLNMVSWNIESDANDIKGINGIHRDTVDGGFIITADLSSTAAGHGKGEVFFDLRTGVPGLGWDGPMNLASRPISMLIKIPEGLVGPEENPNGARLFVEDADYNSQYGTWVNLKEADKWYRLDLVPTFGDIPNGSTEPGFDPSRIIRVGLSVVTPPGSSTEFEGDLNLSFLPASQNDGVVNYTNTPLWMDLRGVQKYIINEDDNYIRVPAVNYLPEQYYSYVFNKGSGEAPEVNFEAIESPHSSWRYYGSQSWEALNSNKGITSVAWDDSGTSLNAGVDISSGKTGEIYLDMRYMPRATGKLWQNGYTLDMSTREVVFYVRAMDGFTANTSRPFEIEAFAKSVVSEGASEVWRDVYSPGVSLDPLGEWIKVTITPSPHDFNAGTSHVDFDPTSVALIGLRVKPVANSHTFSGQLEIRYEVNGVELGAVGLGAEGAALRDPVWVDQREMAGYLRSAEIGLYGDYSVMGMVNQCAALIPGYALPGDMAAFIVYDGNDVVRSISKPDGTTTWFGEGGRVDRITFETGETFVDYEYDDNGNLTNAILVSARDRLRNTMDGITSELEKKTADSLLVLAEQYSLLEENFMNDVNAARRQFASARGSLRAQQYVKVKRRFLFFTWTETLENKAVTQALRDLDRQEAEFNREVSRQLAKLNDELALEHGKIIAEKEKIMAEYKWQEEKMLISILRQEAIPIIHFYYRGLLGRDADEAEIGRLFLKNMDTASYYGDGGVTGTCNFAAFFLPEITDAGAILSALRENKDDPLYLNVSPELKILADEYVPAEDVAEKALTDIASGLDGLLRVYDLYHQLCVFYGCREEFHAVLSASTVSGILEVEHILGKDELDLTAGERRDIEWVNRSIMQDLLPGLAAKEKDPGYFNSEYLMEELSSAAERVEVEVFKTNVINAVIAFLASYIDDSASRGAMLEGLGLERDGVIDVTPEFVEVLEKWLEEQDLHFGRSAFAALKKMIDIKGGGPAEIEELAAKALLIDILIGAGGPVTDNKIAISMYSMSRVAGLYGIVTGAYRVEYDDIISFDPGFVTLINGNHYITVISATESEVTYWDQNLGPGGGEVTISRKDFEDNWQGNVITNDTVEGAKVLSGQVARKIKGSFFWLLIPVLVSVITTSVSAVITAAISAITAVVSGLAGLVGNIAAGIGYAISAIGGALNFAVNSFMGAFSLGGASAVGAGAGTGAVSGFSIGALVEGAGATMVKMGLGYGVNAGLGSLGVDPLVSGLVSSFMTGGAHGLMEGGGLQGAFISAIEYGSAAGMNMLGHHFDLDPIITGILSMSTSVLSGASLDPDVTLKQAIGEIAPHIAGELACYGVHLAGTAMGISSDISAIAGMAVRSSLRMGFSDGQDPGAWLDGAILGTTQGITQLGIRHLIDELDLPPLVEQYGAQLLGMIADSLTPGIVDVINNIFDPSENPALTSGAKPLQADDKYWKIDTETGQREFALDDYLQDMAEWSWREEGYKKMSESLSEHIRRGGLRQAIDNYGSELFNNEMLEAIGTFHMSAGEYFQERVDDGVFEMAQMADGINVARVGVEDAGGNNYGYAYFRQDDTGSYRDLYGYTYGDYQYLGDIFVDPYGKLKLMNGQIVENTTGYIVTRMISNGMHDYVQFSDLYGEVVLGITPSRAGEGIHITESGQLYDGRVFGDGYVCSISGDSISYADTDSGLEWSIGSSGKIDLNLSGSLDLSPEEIRHFSSLDDAQKEQALTAIMFFGGGFGNDNPQGNMSTIMQLFMQDLIADEIVGPDNVFGIATYEGTNNRLGLMRNALLWSMDAVSDSYNPITDEIRSGLYDFLGKLSPEQLSAEVVYFSHSGQFKPLIKALNNDPDLAVNTIINFEGPYVGDQTISNRNVDRVINVIGTQQALEGNDLPQLVKWGPAGAYLDLANVEFRDDPVPFLGPVNFKGIDADGNAFDIQNYNFEIIGARHSDFSYNPEREGLTQEQIDVNRATNHFMRRLSDVTVDSGPFKMSDFLESNGIRYDVDRNIYVVDPILFERGNYE